MSVISTRSSVTRPSIIICHFLRMIRLSIPHMTFVPSIIFLPFSVPTASMVPLLIPSMTYIFMVNLISFLFSPSRFLFIPTTLLSTSPVIIILIISHRSTIWFGDLTLKSANLSTIITVNLSCCKFFELQIFVSPPAGAWNFLCQDVLRTCSP
ncbi:hypothetical protein V6Z12_D06G211300 [Gossypium hirsutum]